MKWRVRSTSLRSGIGVILIACISACFGSAALVGCSSKAPTADGSGDGSSGGTGNGAGSSGGQTTKAAPLPSATGTGTTTILQPITSPTTTSTAPPPGGGGGTASAGCGTAPTPGFVAGKTVDSGGQSRTYDLFVPSGATATTPLPIVFVLHADITQSLRPYFPIEAASAGKAIIVYPYGLNGWDLSAPDDNADVAFLATLKSTLQGSLCADTSKTFAYGYSQGGFLANIIACYRGADMFNAISVNSAGIYAPEGTKAKYDDNGNLVCPATPPAAMVIHGTADNQEPYEDNGVYTRDSWLGNNKCGDTSAAFAPNPCVLYNQCATNSVAFCGVSGMGHQIWANAATATWNYFASL